MAFHPSTSNGRSRTAPPDTTTRSGTRTGRQQAASRSRRRRASSRSREEALELEPDVRVVTPPAGCSCSRPRSCTRPSPTRRAGRVSASTSGPSTSTTWSRASWRAEHRLGVHRDDARRLSAGERPRATAGGADRGATASVGARSRRGSRGPSGVVEPAATRCSRYQARVAAARRRARSSAARPRSAPPARGRPGSAVRLAHGQPPEQRSGLRRAERIDDRLDDRADRGSDRPRPISSVRPRPPGRMKAAATYARATSSA